MRRVSLVSRFSLLVGSCVALPALFACLDHPLKPVEYEASQEEMEGIAITVNKDVDILFVIDNSGSMGEEQGNLAKNFGTFISVLEDPEVKANYRLGVTTTDNGNPWCSGTSPEAGKLRLTSCRSRTSEFIFAGAQMIDATKEACLDVCQHDDIPITPTEIHGQAGAKPRPWLENIEGKTNIPDDITTTEAFQCFGPQGINGCGFESHLESMYKAFVRGETESEEQFAFLRTNAILSVIFVTDEVDCSYNTDWASIFLPESMGGNPSVFWSDPTAAAPTSAVCWNAGVKCTGAGPNYDDCQPVDYDVDGNEVSDGAADSKAVLRPVKRYIDLLQRYEDQKQMTNQNQQVLVAAISGVPEGYHNGSAELQYSDSLTDPQFQADFGIGPGCESPVATAVPPVRLKAFAEAFQVGDQRNLFSVCSESYAPALEVIANLIKDQIKSSCMRACVADTDPVSPELEENCTLTQEAPQDDGSVEVTTIPECGPNDALPMGADVCYVSLWDKDGVTGTDADDMSDECIMEGWNLEFRLVRREGVPAPGGTQVSATCQLSSQKAIDCPLLP